MSYKLSVIIPCFNCTQTLEEAVESCFDQGFLETEFEVVLCDDASSDDTPELLTKLSQQYPNVRTVTHPTNRGGGAARNTAARAASAPVIFCLDSDDLLPTGTLRTMYNCLTIHHLDGVGLHHSTKFRGTNITDVVRVDTFSYAGERIPLENLLQKNNDLCSLYYLHRVAFHQSYYLREYRDGRENINWQAIFLEHLHLFSPVAQTLITNFPARDFTRSLFEELKALPTVLIDPSEQPALLGKSRSLSQPLPTPIPRNSIRGILLRIRAKLLH
jgi:glycosyltransferase involved in cell wall biosynthesis